MKARFNIIDEVFSKSATQNFMLHFSDPDRFEAIVSDGHKNDIVRAFASELGVLEGDREEKIQTIKTAIYSQYGDCLEADEKYRWFFYRSEACSRWRRPSKKRTSKATKQDNEMISAEALDGFVDEYSGEEGEDGLAVVKVRKRDPKLVLFVKERDKYTCKSCGFWFEKRIVHVHHLDPLSEQRGVVKTKPGDLVTLCPNCHALAHDILRDDDQYKNCAILLSKLKGLNEDL